MKNKMQIFNLSVAFILILVSLFLAHDHSSNHGNSMDVHDNNNSSIQVHQGSNEVNGNNNAVQFGGDKNGSSSIPLTSWLTGITGAAMLFLEIIKYMFPRNAK